MHVSICPFGNKNVLKFNTILFLAQGGVGVWKCYSIKHWFFDALYPYVIDWYKSMWRMIKERKINVQFIIKKMDCFVY